MPDPSSFTTYFFAGAAMLVLIAFGIVRSASAERKRWSHPSAAWQATPFERGCAWIMSVGFIGMTIPFFALAEFAWSSASGDLTSSDGFGALILGALTLAFPAIGMSGLYQLAKGNWVAFP